MWDVLERDFLFIIGAPRSGSTWLQIMISAHPQVATTVELTLFSRYTAPWIQAWNLEAENISQRKWYQGLPFLWTEEEFYDFLRQFLKKVYERVIEINPQATHILGKHPGYSLHVEDINKLIPNARFIHLIRDGRDVACSMTAAHRNVGFGPHNFEQAAQEWKQHVLAAKKAKRFPDRYFEIRYEDLLISGNKSLKAVFDFCGLPISHDEVAEIINAHQFEKMRANKQAADKRVKAHQGHYYRGKADYWLEETNPLQRYLFDEIAGDLLLDLGYAKDGWWANSSIQRITLPVLAAILTGEWRRRRVAQAVKSLLRNQSVFQSNYR